ncbi:MAG: YicC family protein [Hungatella sp.]|nr:YicC family protein [Hungatella sp.]
MIRSMTGFGRCENVTEQYKISVEMKAVNHRYLDLGIKMPKRFNYFESGIRGLLKTYIQRGKVDLFISYEDYTGQKLCLKYNESLAGEYVQYFKQMSEKFSIDNDMTTGVLARMPEVLTMEQEAEDEEAMWKILSQAVEEAAKKFVESRSQEGESLKEDLLGKLKTMAELVAFVEQRSPAIVAEYQGKLEAKVKELLGGSGIDESRIVTEVTIFADKVCVDEEIVRLKSHISHMENELKSGGGVGRKLDFLAQEMNREANTILSKANDLELSDKAIALKTEIEKIREQIQNIE